MPNDVFISYSSKDKDAATVVCSALESQGISCWMAPRDILPGKTWGGAIVEGIEQSRIFLLIYTAQSNASQQVLREVDRAVNKNIIVLPFRLENVPLTSDLEYFLSSCHWMDALQSPLEKHLDGLAAAVNRLLGKDVPQRPAPVAAGKAKPKWLAAGIVAALCAICIAGVFLFTNKDTTAPPPVLVTATVASDDRAKQKPTVDDLAFQEAVNAYTAEALNAYITTYPQGRHVVAARQHLQKLQLPLKQDLEFDYSFVALRKTPGKGVEKISVTDGAELHSGDQFYLSFQASTACYAYIINEDSRGAMNILFPNQLAGDNRIEPGVSYKIPTGGPEMMFELDDMPGTETMYIVASREPQPEVQRLLAAITKPAGADSAQAVAFLREKLQQLGAGTKNQVSGAAVTAGPAEKLTGSGIVVRKVTFQHR